MRVHCEWLPRVYRRCKGRRSVTHIDEGAVAEAEYFIKKMRTLGMRAELQQTGEHKRMHELSKTPDSAKKCRILDGHPSGESLY